MSTMPKSLSAQTVDQVATAPPNLVLANYDSVPVGPFGGLEGSAYAARVSDPSAAWFNPAGLSRQTTAQISGSAGVYEWTSVSPLSLTNNGGSLQQLPNFAGFSFNVRGGLTAGFSVLTTNSWTQQTDAERIDAVPNGQQRVAYSSGSEFTRRIAAVGVGYQGGGAWRIGGGFAFSMMELRLVESMSDRIADTAGLRTLLVVARASGSAVQLRTQGGVQYDTSKFRFGAAIRTPGLTIIRDGTVTLDGTLDAGVGSLGASLFDADASFTYRLPWELQGGAAYVRDRMEIEIDVHGYTPVSAYSLLATDKPTLIYGDAGTGGPPSVISRPFTGLTSASNGVVNVALGGHLKVMRDRDFRIHAGFAANQSPVGDADQVFTDVNLASWSIGVSGTLAKFQFAAGLNRRSGTAKDVVVRNRLTEPLHTDVDVSGLGFIYSIGYQF
ncbi:MAG: hypothetical protein ND807_13670 [Vicinamibacterales bacterium]|nr:hypothetical protein [Vicinamibacterales bacterium]